MFANINFVLILIITIVFLVTIFPLFVDVKIFFSKNLKKLFFVISLFRIPFLSGYAHQIKKGIVIHLTKNFAMIIPYSSVFNLKNNVKPLKDYHFINFYSSIDIGAKHNNLSSLSIAFIINNLSEFLRRSIINYKPYLKINSTINVYEEKDTLQVFIKIIFVFNLLMIILSLIKMATEKIINEFRKKTRQN